MTNNVGNRDGRLDNWKICIDRYKYTYKTQGMKKCEAINEPHQVCTIHVMGTAPFRHTGTP